VHVWIFKVVAVVVAVAVVVEVAVVVKSVLTREHALCVGADTTGGEQGSPHCTIVFASSSTSTQRLSRCHQLPSSVSTTTSP
jgi:hypothetical protein